MTPFSSTAFPVKSPALFARVLNPGRDLDGALPGQKKPAEAPDVPAIDRITANAEIHKLLRIVFEL